MNHIRTFLRHASATTCILVAAGLGCSSNDSNDSGHVAGTAGRAATSAGAPSRSESPGGVSGKSNGGASGTGVAGQSALTAGDAAGSAGLPSIAPFAGTAGAAGAAGSAGFAGRTSDAGSAGLAGTAGFAGGNVLATAGSAGAIAQAPFYRVTATTADATLRLASGKKTDITVTVKREGSDNGAVLVSLAGVSGVAAPSVIVPSGTISALLSVEVQGSASVGGPFPLTISATSQDDPSITSKTVVPLYIAETPGTRDSGFGYKGVISLKVAPAASDSTLTQDYPNDVDLDDKGRIIIGGYTDTRGWVARLLSDGTLDPKFDNDGKIVGIGGTQSSVQKTAVVGDQLYVATSVQSSSGTTNYLRKLAEDGTADAKFNGGLDVKLTSSPTDMLAFRNGVLIAASGPPISYTADGKIDPSFLAPDTVVAENLAIDAKGQVLFATRNSTNTAFDVGRLLPTGALDSSFNARANGISIATCPTTDPPRAYLSNRTGLVVTPTNPVALITCGSNYLENYNWESRLVALTNSGALALTFGEGYSGWRSVTAPGKADAVVAQADGKILVLYSTLTQSTADGPITYQYYLTRFTSTGAPDTSFGKTGTIDLSDALSDQSLYPMKLAYDAKSDRVVIAAVRPSSNGIVVVRVWL